MFKNLHIASHRTFPTIFLNHSNHYPKISLHVFYMYTVSTLLVMSPSIPLSHSAVRIYAYVHVVLILFGWVKQTLMLSATSGVTVRKLTHTCVVSRLTFQIDAYIGPPSEILSSFIFYQAVSRCFDRCMGPYSSMFCGG